MNYILRLQDEEAQLRLRRAIRACYDTAQEMVLLQVICAVVIPVTAAITAFFLPEAKPYTATLSMLLVLVDIYYLDRRQKDLLKLGAKFGEEYDTRVLDLPWDSFAVGDRPTPEELHAAESKFKARKTKAALTGWYPEAVGQAPIHLARLMCQRANLSYNEALRRGYSNFVIKIAIGIVVCLVAAALFQNLHFADWVLVLTPAMPALTWAGREHLRQRDAADVQDTIRKQARKTWDDALAGKCGVDQCLLKAREFQSAIYLRRATAPMILPGVYASKRDMLEDQMQSTAADFLGEYQRTTPQQQ